MTTQNIYHVIATTPGCWKVIADGAEPTFHSTESEAVSTAREWAMINEPGQVVIHKADGSIEEEYVMPMDSFPHSPAGASDTGHTSDDSSTPLHSNLSQRTSQRRRGSEGGYSTRGNASL